MEIISSLNKHVLNKTIFRIVGSVLFFKKQTVNLFLYYLQKLILWSGFLTSRIKRPPDNIYYEANGLINRLLGGVRLNLQGRLYE